MMRCLDVALFTWLLTLRALAGSPFPDRLAELQAQLAHEPTNSTLLLNIGELCYDEGSVGNAKAVDLAQKYLNQLLALEPGHALGMALLGSATTMKARDAFWPNVRLRYANEGVKIMDAAVKLAPEDPLVRFVRAENNFHMPNFMEREEIARSDLTWLWEQARDPAKDLKPHFKQRVAYYQGLSLKKQKLNEEAARVWQAGLEFDPLSETAGDIRKQLK